MYSVAFDVSQRTQAPLSSLALVVYFPLAAEHSPVQGDRPLWPDARGGHQHLCLDTYAGEGVTAGDNHLPPEARG